MKKILFLFFALILSAGCIFATEDSAAGTAVSEENTVQEAVIPETDAVKEAAIVREQTIQEKINDVAFKLLNANKIDKRIIFVYDKAAKKSLLKSADEVTKRQVALYENDIKFISNEDELAAFLARGISMALKSYGGIWNGSLNAIEVKAAPKIYEIFADKRAVDFMVNAGYDPIGLITYLNKAVPQKRFDMFSNTNLTSKRLAVIYEYIYTKYPYYLKNNKYFETDSYQNFLLTSQYNRKLLENKIKNKSHEELKYE